MFGVSASPEMYMKGEKQIMIPVEAKGVKLLSIGLMTARGQAIVWRGPMVSSAFRQFVQDTDWGDLDYLIIDLPPGTGDAQLSLVQNVPLTGVVIVTTPQEMALTDARRAMGMFSMEAVNKKILGVVENMSYFTPEDAPDKKYKLFGEGGGKALSEEYGVPFLGELPLNPALMKLIDEGHLTSDAIELKPYYQVAGCFGPTSEYVANHKIILLLLTMSEINQQVEQVLETMRPYLHADGGDVELVEVSQELDVVLRLTGACSTCSMSEMTMTAGIEESLRRAIPNIGKITALKN
jgi:ATP-binding protein involved in chromosome partitioning